MLIVASGVLIENLNGRLIIATHDQILLSDRSFISIDVPKITASEQLSTWVDALGASAVSLKEQIYSLISQFNLSQQAIYKAVETATTTIYATPADDLCDFGEVLWDSCRKIARPQLNNLAKRIDYKKLAFLNATGATISNIAMHAAFLAAEASEPVMMKHLHTAAIAECLKEGYSTSQIKGWV